MMVKIYDDANLKQRYPLSSSPICYQKLGQMSPKQSVPNKEWHCHWTTNDDHKLTTIHHLRRRKFGLLA